MVNYRSDVAPLASFEAHAGKNVSIVHLFQSWGDPKTQLFNPVLLEAIRNHRAIPLLTWNSATAPITPNQPGYSLHNIIHGNFDAYITSFAEAAKAWGHPFFLRLNQEMDLGWAPWSEEYSGKSVNGNRPRQFVTMWRHVHDIFTRVGATNALWVWSPSRVGNLVTYKNFYPGDSYVNWTCTDVQNTPHTGASSFVWQSFAQLFAAAYRNLLAISAKPIMLAELGSYEDQSNPQAKANWITDLLETQLPHTFPAVKAFVWWNVNPHTNIESSVLSQQAFSSAIQNPLYVSEAPMD